ncbi:LysE family translocator [Streptomyces mirabilis]
MRRKARCVSACRVTPRPLASHHAARPPRSPAAGRRRPKVPCRKPGGVVRHPIARQADLMLSSVIAFIGAAFLIAMVPGPSTAVILRRAVMNGRRSGIATVLGNECGVLLWGIAAALGLSALLLASQVAYDAMRIFGAALLVWMGARALWRARRPGDPATRVRNRRKRRRYRTDGRTGRGWSPISPIPRRACSPCPSCRSSSRRELPYCRPCSPSR